MDIIGIGYVKQQSRYTVIGIKSGKPKSKPPPNLSKIGDLNPPKMVAHCWVYHLQDNPFVDVDLEILETSQGKFVTSCSSTVCEPKQLFKLKLCKMPRNLIVPSFILCVLTISSQLSGKSTSKYLKPSRLTEF